MEILYVPYHSLSYMWDFGCIPNNHSRPLNKEPPSHPLFSKFSSLPFISQRFSSLYSLKGYRDSPYYPRIFSSLPFYLWEFELSLIKELAIKPPLIFSRTPNPPFIFKDSWLVSIEAPLYLQGLCGSCPLELFFFCLEQAFLPTWLAL